MMIVAFILKMWAKANHRRHYHQILSKISWEREIILIILILFITIILIKFFLKISLPLSLSRETRGNLHLCLFWWSFAGPATPFKECPKEVQPSKFRLPTNDMAPPSKKLKYINKYKYKYKYRLLNSWIDRMYEVCSCESINKKMRASIRRVRRPQGRPLLFSRHIKMQYKPM